MRPTVFLRSFGIVCLLWSGSVCRASIIGYDISMNTSPLIGHAAAPFSLAFQFTDGSGAGDANNSIVLSNFLFGLGGSAVGSPTLFGDATGSLASGITLTDSSFFNAFTQQFTPGSLLTFRLEASTNLDLGGTPDEFAFSILDNTGTELPTTGFFDVFMILDIDSANPIPQSFSSDPNRSPVGGGSGITMNAPQVTAAVPEPSSFMLLGIGLAFLSRRFIRSGN